MQIIDKLKNLFTINYDEFDDDYYGDDFYDDVDESNYNPFTGADEYESEPFDLEW